MGEILGALGKAAQTYGTYRDWVDRKAIDMTEFLGATPQEAQEANEVVNRYGGFALPMAAPGGAMRALTQYMPASGALRLPNIGYNHPEDAARIATKMASGLGGENIVPVIPMRTPAKTDVLRQMVQDSHRVYDSSKLSNYAMRPTTGLTAPFPAAVELPSKGTAYYARMRSGPL